MSMYWSDILTFALIVVIGLVVMFLDAGRKAK